MAACYIGALLWGLFIAPALIIEHPAVLAVVVPIAALTVVEYRAGLPPYRPT